MMVIVKGFYFKKKQTYKPGSVFFKEELLSFISNVAHTTPDTTYPSQLIFT